MTDATNWQPIKTAPHDGTRILLYPQMCVAHWEFGDDQWMVLPVLLEEDGQVAADWNAPPKRWYCLYANVQGIEPTHWRPLPDPPDDASDAECVGKEKS